MEGKLEFLEQILANNFSYINASGKVFDKTAYLDFFIRSKQFRWNAQDLDDLKIRRYGDIAVMTCRIFDRASYQDQEFDGYFCFDASFSNNQSAGDILQVKQRWLNSDFSTNPSQTIVSNARP